MKRSAPVLVGAWLVTAAACGRDAPASGGDHAPAAPAAKTAWGEVPIAEVGTGVITRERLERTLRARRLVADKTGQAAPDPGAVLDELIDDELLVQLALKIGVLANDEALRGRLIAAALDQRLPKPHRPTDDELRAFVTAHADDFPAEERLRIRHIVVKAPPPAAGEDVTAQRRRAERIHAQVSRAPATFEDEAKKQSDDPTGPRGGDLGYLPVDRFALVLGRELPAAAAATEVGKVGPIVRSVQGFHIFMVVDRKPAGADPLEVQLREVLAAYMEDQRARERYSLLETLRRELAVRVHDPTLAHPPAPDEDDK